MKKSLLLLAFAVVATVGNVKAQTTWDFSSASWPLNATGEPVSVVKNNLGLVPGESANFGIIEANAPTFPDGSSYTKRFKLNGGGYDSTGSSAVPTKRYLTFKVNGNFFVIFWYKNGGGGDRTLFIGNGTEILGSKVYSNSADGLIYTFEYTGPAANLYIYGDTSLNLYKITATNVGTTVLGLNDVTKGMKASVYTAGNKVFLSNLDSKNTQVNVYNANGSLVKTMTASADTNFEVNAKGFYIVNLKSDAGQKSVKVIIK